MDVFLGLFLRFSLNIGNEMGYRKTVASALTLVATTYKLGNCNMGESISNRWNKTLPQCLTER